MVQYVLFFGEVDRTSLPEVGGKGANLGEMAKAGFPVPAGFCVTTAAYRDFIGGEMGELFGLLDGVRPDDLAHIRELGQRIRDRLRSLPVPDGVRASILEAWKRTGEDKAYAVRSSATVEDLPTASFAGQQETYLNVRGRERLLEAVRDCWASLFTDRAISYRARNSFYHRAVFLSVVVQEMVFPEVSGIMFTADPVTGRRHTAPIDASYGLGEALVSGLVTADLYKAHSGAIASKRISKKTLAIYALPEGGTVKKEVTPEKQEAQALPDDRILELARLGEKIEAHYGAEQDIEWCLAGGKFYILQSRPVTSLFPVPHVSGDGLHVLVSFGHIQMMMDAMRPLAISVLEDFLSFAKPYLGGDPLVEAGGRLFIDPTPALALKPARYVTPKILGVMFDEGMAASMKEVSGRDDFRRHPGGRMKASAIIKLLTFILPGIGGAVNTVLFADPAPKRNGFISSAGHAWADLEEEMASASGPRRRTSSLAKYSSRRTPTPGGRPCSIPQRAS